MDIKRISKIITGLEHLAHAQDTSIYEILDALIGVCFDEEQAGDLKQYLKNNEY